MEGNFGIQEGKLTQATVKVRQGEELVEWEYQPDQGVWTNDKGEVSVTMPLDPLQSRFGSTEHVNALAERLELYHTQPHSVYELDYLGFHITVKEMYLGHPQRQGWYALWTQWKGNFNRGDWRTSVFRGDWRTSVPLSTPERAMAAAKELIDQGQSEFPPQTVEVSNEEADDPSKVFKFIVERLRPMEGDILLFKIPHQSQMPGSQVERLRKGFEQWRADKGINLHGVWFTGLEPQRLLLQSGMTVFFVPEVGISATMREFYRSDLERLAEKVRQETGVKDFSFVLLPGPMDLRQQDEVSRQILQEEGVPTLQELRQNIQVAELGLRVQQLERQIAGMRETHAKIAEEALGVGDYPSKAELKLRARIAQTIREHRFESGTLQGEMKPVGFTNGNDETWYHIANDLAAKKDPVSSGEEEKPGN